MLLATNVPNHIIAQHQAKITLSRVFILSKEQLVGDLVLVVVLLSDDKEEEEEQGWTRSNGDQTSGLNYFRTESMFSLQTKRVWYREAILKEPLETKAVAVTSTCSLTK